jgi:hypothetical protein
MTIQTATTTPTVETGNDTADQLIAAVADKPGQEVGKIARRTGVDKGVAGRVMSWLVGERYLCVERVGGKLRYYVAN